MAEIADHLIPQDGISHAKITFAGLDADPDSGGCTCRFDLHQEEDLVGTFAFFIAPTPERTIDSQVVQAHYAMIDSLREMLYRVDVARQAYEARLGSGRQ